MSAKNFFARKLPPRLGMPLRHLFGGGREPEMKILKYLVQETGAVIDVGANRGTYAWPLSRMLGVNQELILIEPQANFMAYLSQAFKSKSNVRLIQKAASMKNAVMQINVELDEHNKKSGAVSMEHYYPNSVAQEIETLAIDSLDLDECAFIKIDIDGHELDCLIGGYNTILKSLPVLLVEIELRMAGEKCLSTYRLLRDGGYLAYSFHNQKLSVVAESQFSTPELNQHPDKTFRNNFIFLAPKHYKILEKLI
jgi:FkbM family methyltransferase